MTSSGHVGYAAVVSMRAKALESMFIAAYNAQPAHLLPLPAAAGDLAAQLFVDPPRLQVKADAQNTVTMLVDGYLKIDHDGGTSSAFKVTYQCRIGITAKYWPAGSNATAKDKAVDGGVTLQFARQGQDSCTLARAAGSDLTALQSADYKAKVLSAMEVAIGTALSSGAQYLGLSRLLGEIVVLQNTKMSFKVVDGGIAMGFDIDTIIYPWTEQRLVSGSDGLPVVKSDGTVETVSVQVTIEDTAGTITVGSYEDLHNIFSDEDISVCINPVALRRALSSAYYAVEGQILSNGANAKSITLSVHAGYLAVNAVASKSGVDFTLDAQEVPQIGWPAHNTVQNEDGVPTVVKVPYQDELVFNAQKIKVQAKENAGLSLGSILNPLSGIGLEAYLKSKAEEFAGEMSGTSPQGQLSSTAMIEGTAFNIRLKQFNPRETGIYAILSVTPAVTVAPPAH